ncbi:MAG TPA: glycoside hydrolase family 9 protein [Verrucomicrobiae bacterium]|jgi:hypothetical protein|nr:glycoside hydrolase family 9 protein [Verrucomicrobiae bacterium]
MVKVAKVLMCLSIIAGAARVSGASVNIGGNVVNGVVWADDALPTGAQPGADGGDGWNWVSGNPTPYSGSLAHQSSIEAGLHEHYFTGATQTLTVNAGDTLFTAVYIDPANVPSEIMLQWNDSTGSWAHRAYWGNYLITYGANGSAGSYYMGPMPAAGQWTLLQVPANDVGLGGTTLGGMAFSEFNGRATWDFSGDATSITTNETSGVSTNTPTGPTGTNTTTTTSNGTATTNAIPGTTPIDYTMLQQPTVGENSLHVLSPTVLELNIVNSEPRGTMVPTNLASFLNADGQFIAPALGDFSVTINGQSVAVTGVGFKRRPLYAPNKEYDLLILNSFYLQVATPVADTQTVQVQNPGAALWPTNDQFVAVADPLRYSPAIHVNQEGYMPDYTKQAMVGYYLGTLGEMPIPYSSGFSIINATNGAVVYTGNLTERPDGGWEYSPAPYQHVYMADFSDFNTPGQYRLQVAGMGASLPFLIDPGIGMSFARTYALGLYHQRCGTNLGLPYTRFQHAMCHDAPALVPAVNNSTFNFTWTTISNYTTGSQDPAQTAQLLISPDSQMFRFVNTNPVSVTGGHHDAGDYSKYTINSASLIHYLIFEVDSISGIAAMDNLGIPESGDGISDVMQEAKWESDFLAKMQDSDGGFYFLVYPTNEEYESNVTPDKGSGQLVWPKTTSVTAAAVAALAQCATSPLFKKTYPTEAALYLQKAQLGWKFLTNAVNHYGVNMLNGVLASSGAYQKITSYGDDFADSDELCWAACQMYLATGDQTAHQMLLAWLTPTNSATYRWGWWHLSESYGNCIRSYAFAVQSGRVAASALNPTFLSQCQSEVIAAGNDALAWSQESAYGTSFPPATKAVLQPGWYFSADQAFDMAVAYQLTNNPAYINGIIANMNYEAGCNPVNVCYDAGLGIKRPRDFVSQWELNDIRSLPPTGLPEGNLQTAFEGEMWYYGDQLLSLSVPSDGTTNPLYPIYDRWGDSWNVTTEMVILNSARSIGSMGFLASLTAAASVPWHAVPAQINVPTGIAAVGSNVTLTMQAAGVDFSGARITWEARDQQPAFGQSFTYAPINNGPQWVEAEAQWPDGRRIFATNVFNANSPNIIWVDDSIPAGGIAGSAGGDSWNWVSSNPTPYSGAVAQQSAIEAGAHQVYFSDATAPLNVGANSTLYAWIYLDPKNPPSEAMLQWFDGASWHRAYWGANDLTYGAATYVGSLASAGSWQQLTVPASQVGLQGASVSGLAFSLNGGRATWDCAGELNPMTNGVGTNSNLGGTNPGSPTTVKLNSIQVSASQPLLSWNTTSGIIYQVMYKNNLTDPSWTVAQTLTGTGATAAWTDTNTAGTQRFYIVEQVQQGQ